VTEAWSASRLSTRPRLPVDALSIVRRSCSPCPSGKPHCCAPTVFRHHHFRKPSLVQDAITSWSRLLWLLDCHNLSWCQELSHHPNYRFLCPPSADAPFAAFMLQVDDQTQQHTHQLLPPPSLNTSTIVDHSNRSPLLPSVLAQAILSHSLQSMPLHTSSSFSCFHVFQYYSSALLCYRVLLV
jgi:hypothetical protein